VISLGWGGVVFYLLSTAPFQIGENIPVDPGVEFAINVLSIGWLIASSLVKVGLILKRRWIKVSIISCLCFIFLMMNVGLMQAKMNESISSLQVQTPPPSSLYLLTATWFTSWFWIDAFLIFTYLGDLIKKKISNL